MIDIDRVRLEFISPYKLTDQRRFEMSSKEACQVIKDIQQEYGDYIIEEIEDFTKVECIRIIHFCPEQPNEETELCFELSIKKELLLFIRTHKMPQEVKPG